MNRHTVSSVNPHMMEALERFKFLFHSIPLQGMAAEVDTFRPGLLVVEGFDSANKTHTSNVVNGTKHPLVGSSLENNPYEILKTFLQLIHEDGAIIIGYKGKLERIGARLLNNVEPEDVALFFGREISEMEWETLGFAHPANTRHVNALYASFIMKGTTAYTLSAKTGEIRAYKDGKIIESSVPEELYFNNLLPELSL